MKGLSGRVANTLIYIRSLKTYRIALLALSLYDYCLTFSAETDLVWNSRKTTASTLFLLNRYSSVAFSITGLVSYASPWSRSVCNRYAVAEFAWMTWLYCIASTFLILRVYVLTRKNKYIVAILVCHLLALIGVALRILSFTGQIGLKEDVVVPRKHPHPHDRHPFFKEHSFQVCMLNLDHQSYPFYYAYLALGQSFETIVFATTLITTVAASRPSSLPTRRWLKVMQRDGFLYFFATFFATLIWLLNSFVSKNTPEVINAVPCSTLIAIMVNRLYLSLKEAGQENGDELAQLPAPILLQGDRNGRKVELQVILSTEVTSSIL
ncbi:hypothetical protein L208DRAFT_366773 [Tricholoma matsutake]|nr:hypothetical protein L208DRAFT_366773 [Tricholoma matsutake 945]